MTLHRIYGLMIVALALVTIWAAFDVRERFFVVVLVQVPVLVMRAVWKYRH